MILSTVRTFGQVCMVGIVVLGLLPATSARAQSPNNLFPTSPSPEDYWMGGKPAEPRSIAEASFIRIGGSNSRTTE